MGRIFKSIFSLSPTIYFIFFIFGIFAGSFAMYAVRSNKVIEKRENNLIYSTNSTESEQFSNFKNITSPLPQSIQSVDSVFEADNEQNISESDSAVEKNKSTKSAEIQNIVEPIPATENATSSARESDNLPFIEDIAIADPEKKEIKITGKNFGQNSGKVLFEDQNNKSTGEINEWSDVMIELTLPNEITIGHEYFIYIETNDKKSSEKDRFVIN